MSLMLALDNEQSAMLEALAPHKNMYDANRPRALTNVAEMPKPMASTITSWMHHDRVLSGDPHKQAFLLSLAH
jgi:hypothetical protein